MRSGAGTALFALAFSAAADQASTDVGAEIVGTCKIDLATLVDFGDLEQGPTAADRIASGSVRFWCSKGLRYSVRVDDGANHLSGHRRMKGQAPANSTEYLPYDLRPRGRENGTGLGPKAPEIFEMEAEVKGSDYNGLSAGGFLDTVVVTISP